MTTPQADDVTVVVLAGGESRRFGSDKLAAPLGGSTVLDHVVAGLPAAWPLVVVGAARPTVGEVAWTREDPPGGGPLAAVEAGLALVRTGILVVVAGDMPFAGSVVRTLVDALREASPGVVAAVGTDEDGVPNPLLAAYRSDAVREGLPQPAHGRPARSLLRLPHVEVRLTGPAVRDVDTPADLEALGGPPEGRASAPGQPGFGAPGRA